MSDTTQESLFAGPRRRQWRYSASNRDNCHIFSNQKSKGEQPLHQTRRRRRNRRHRRSRRQRTMIYEQARALYFAGERKYRPPTPINDASCASWYENVADRCMKVFTKPVALNTLSPPVGIQRQIINNSAVGATILDEQVGPSDPSPGELYYSPTSPPYSPWHASITSQEDDENSSVVIESVAAVDVLNQLFELLPKNYDHLATIRHLKGISSDVASRSSPSPWGSPEESSHRIPLVVTNPSAAVITRSSQDEPIVISSDSDMDTDVES